MGFVSKEPVKVTVEDRPDEWIAIKAKMSVGDRGAFSDAIMTVSAGVGKDSEDTKVNVKAGQYLAALLRMNIVDWRFLGDDGQPVPFKRELIADLDPDDTLIDAVLEEIARRNPTLAATRAKSGSES